MKIGAAFYSVTLSIVIAMFGCKKNTAPPFPLNYTSKMGGIRSWSGVIVRGIFDTSGGTFILHIDSTYINDTFAVTIINDQTIQLPDFLKLSTLNNIMIYQYYSTDSIAFISPVGYNLIYNYQDNIINYYGVTADSDGTTNLILHSP